jgi:hypothetical protein
MRNKQQDILSRSFPNEQWKEIKIELKTRYRYSISNYGRLVSFRDKFEDCLMLNGCITA